MEWGLKSALAILSGMSIDDLTEAVANQDVALMTPCARGR